MSNTHQHNKSIIKILCKSLYDFDEQAVRDTLKNLFRDDAVCHYSHPFGDLSRDQLYEGVFAPLAGAFPDVERRDIICIAGADQDGAEWVGCAGHYVGRFMAHFLGIPPTGHIAHLRFHEFYRLVDGRVAEVQAIWDLPELMMQANVWPMGVSLGREWQVPSPASQDGLQPVITDDAQTNKSVKHVIDMLTAMQRYPLQGGAEVMELDKFWHPHFNWYGPAGIGSSRGKEGFRNWHQTPFLKAMPDRGQYPEETVPYFFAEGGYVAVTGWPNMAQTLKGDGWLGIAPTDQKITLRSLDFWRLEAGRIRENWVLVDLLDMWSQIGVDVIGRMRQLASAQPLANIKPQMEGG